MWSKTVTIKVPSVRTLALGVKSPHELVHLNKIISLTTASETELYIDEVFMDKRKPRVKVRLDLEKTESDQRKTDIE